MVLFNYSNIIDPLLKDLRILVPKFSGMKKGDRVLDVCCGTGDQVFHYAQKGILGVGVDINPHMFKVAKKRKEKNKLKNVSFLLWDAQNLPFQSNFFDFVSISLGLHEIDTKLRKRVVDEMKRVLKKDGSLVLADFHSPLPNNKTSFFIKAIEYLAGQKHYYSFKDYIQKGGLPFLLEQNKLKEEKRIQLKNGLLTIIKAKI